MTTTAYQDLAARQQRLYRLGHLQAIAQWDQAANMPAHGNEARSLALAEMDGLLHELATDLHCIIAGFGAIQMTAAEESGWAGYMTQPARAVALAEFLHHKGLAPDSANPWLPLRSQTWLKKAQRDL